MLICNCTLAGTKACLSCPSYINELGETMIVKPYDGTITEITEVNHPSVRTITREYDNKGNLIKEIIEYVDV